MSVQVRWPFKSHGNVGRGRSFHVRARECDTKFTKERYMSMISDLQAATSSDMDVASISKKNPPALIRSHLSFWRAVALIWSSWQSCPPRPRLQSHGSSHASLEDGSRPVWGTDGSNMDFPILSMNLEIILSGITPLMLSGLRSWSRVMEGKGCGCLFIGF